MRAMTRKVASRTEAKRETSAAQSVARQLADACLIFFRLLALLWSKIGTALALSWSKLRPEAGATSACGSPTRRGRSRPRFVPVVRCLFCIRMMIQQLCLDSGIGTRPLGRPVKSITDQALRIFFRFAENAIPDGAEPVKSSLRHATAACS